MTPLYQFSVKDFYIHCSIFLSQGGTVLAARHQCYTKISSPKPHPETICNGCCYFLVKVDKLKMLPGTIEMPDNHRKLWGAVTAYLAYWFFIHGRLVTVLSKNAGPETSCVYRILMSVWLCVIQLFKTSATGLHNQNLGPWAMKCAKVWIQEVV